MSDDVVSVMTPYPDVAQLAEGYLQRADGERLWVPLSAPTEPGEGVRFVIHLADGTVGFGGAGRCVQVADQGEDVDAAIRYEALLDSLQFDERSQPVYDYIVAVRAAVLEDEGQPEGDDAEASSAVDAAEETAEAATHAFDDADAVDGLDPAEAALDGEEDAEDDFVDEGDLDLGGDLDRASAAFVADPETGVNTANWLQGEPPFTDDSTPVEAPQTAAGATADTSAVGAVAAADVEYAHEASGALNAGTWAGAEAGADERVTSIPPPIPEDSHPTDPAHSFGAPEAEAVDTGILTRPAIATHWHLEPPRPPAPTSTTGLFQYEGRALPQPQQLPRPTDPYDTVTAAPHPRDYPQGSTSPEAFAAAIGAQGVSAAAPVGPEGPLADDEGAHDDGSLEQRSAGAEPVSFDGAGHRS